MKWWWEGNEVEMRRRLVRETRFWREGGAQVQTLRTMIKGMALEEHVREIHLTDRNWAPPGRAFEEREEHPQ